MRARPSAALVVAVLALVVSLAGTAEASFLITKNNQVGPHTIAGANAPKGDNHNLIAGSVGAADLHTGAVTGQKVASNAINGSKVADGAITSSDLNLANVAAGLQVRSVSGSASPGNSDAFFHVGPWTLTGHCLDNGGGNYEATIDLAISGGAALVTVGDGSGSRGTSTVPVVQTASATTTSVAANDFSAALPLFTNEVAGRVMATADVDDFSGPACVFTFGGIGS